jgi:hypothetical protein
VGHVRGNSAYRTAGRRVKIQTLMARGTVKSERRRKSRKRPTSLIYVELASANGGMMRDLSAEGFAVRAMMPLRAGEKTPFSFLLGGSVQIAGEGEILWIEEDGRVAGVRFTEISSEALAEIQNWLNSSSELQKAKQVSEKIEAPPPSTFDQLREELRSAPVEEKPPEHVRTESPAVALENVSVTPEAPPSAAAPESAPPIAVAPAAKESLGALASAVVVDAAPLSAPQALIQAANRMEEPPEAIPHAPGLPDISEILIQPRRKEAMRTQDSAVLEPLPVPERAPETPRTNWMDWFTLSKAVTIMLVLATAAAVSVFHTTVGQGLIWLGEAMGGSQIRQAQLPAASDIASPSSPNPISPNVQDSSTPESTPAENAAPNRENQTDSPATGNSSQTSPSSATRNALAPGTPLAGNSGVLASDSSQEPGQAEYLHAEQLLRGKNAGADQAEAVRLLWAAVEKGNPNAEVRLAEMYLYGQGVVRNCDQTRILLNAAARKGSAQAQKLLQQFQREGCE